MSDVIFYICYLPLALALISLGYWLDVVMNRRRQIKDAERRRANV